MNKTTDFFWGGRNEPNQRVWENTNSPLQTPKKLLLTVRILRPARLGNQSGNHHPGTLFWLQQKQTRWDNTKHHMLLERKDHVNMLKQRSHNKRTCRKKTTTDVFRSRESELIMDLTFFIFFWAWQFCWWPFWDGENVTLSRANRDIQLGDKARSRLESPGGFLFPYIWGFFCFHFSGFPWVFVVVVMFWCCFGWFGGWTTHLKNMRKSNWKSSPNRGEPKKTFETTT